MPLAHSVFKQNVHNVSAHQLQQHTIEICYKMINCLINELVKETIVYCRQNDLLCRYDICQPWHLSLIVFQHSTPHMITHRHILMVHFFTSESQFNYLFT